MAVMRQSLTFGGVNSADFGIYISGEGVFNAPKRAVEMVSIPGRNGALTVDQGYYENITVTYPAFNAEDDLDTFKSNLAAFRNALCSQIGYQRLTDSFHSSEYRLAVFSNGFEIDPIKYNTASEFELEFDCMPQRFLLSGETALSPASGGSVTNPTDYDSSPLLAVDGYGTIEFNGYTIELEQATVGEVKLFEQSTSEKLTKTFTINNSLYNIGDTITLSGAVVTRELLNLNSWFKYIYTTDIVDVRGITTLTKKSNTTMHAVTTIPSETIVAGTPETFTETINITIEYTNRDATTETTYAVIWQYVPGENEDTITFSIRTSSIQNASVRDDYVAGASCSVDSSIEALGDPTYIDCDLGECYMIVNDEIVSLNSWVDLGSDLPVLAPGENTVTFDDTVTGLEITPRWWQL